MSRQREPFRMVRHERGYEKGYYRKCFGEEETWADHCTMGRNIIVGLVHPEAVRAPTGGPDCRPCFPSGSLVRDGTDDVIGLALLRYSTGTLNRLPMYTWPGAAGSQAGRRKLKSQSRYLERAATGGSDRRRHLQLHHG